MANFILESTLINYLPPFLIPQKEFLVTQIWKKIQIGKEKMP